MILKNQQIHTHCTFELKYKYARCAKRIFSLLSTLNMTSWIRIGASHPFPWPRTLGFQALNAREIMVQRLKENKIYSISEKLDGCNVCISSEGYIASRNYVIESKRFSRNLNAFKWQGIPMHDGVLLMEKAQHLKSLLAKQIFKGLEFEVLLYGELMKKGSGSSKQDIFNYEKKNIHPGKIYVFAMGLVLPKNVPLPFIFNHGYEAQGSCPTMHIVPLNAYLMKLFSRVSIDHVPLLATGRLCDLLCNKRFNEMLRKRQVEGFVLSGTEGQQYIKWKYNRDPNEKLTEHLKQMLEECKDTPGERPVTYLQQLCDVANTYITNVDDTYYKSFVQMFMEDKDENDGYATEFLREVKKGVAFGSLGLSLVLEKTADDIHEKINSSISITNAIDPSIQAKLKHNIYLELKKYTRSAMDLAKEIQKKQN